MRAVFALFVPLFLLCSVARADSPSETDTQAAKIHYQAGEQYYLRGHYPEAIAEFKEAYRLSQAAALLYNISQAYDRLGDSQNARDYLQKYLDSGSAEPGEVASLREKLRILDKRIADEKGTSPPPSPTVDTTVPPPSGIPPITPEPRPEEHRPWRTWKWVAGGVGAGCLVLAVLFAADAHNMEQKLEDAAKTQQTYVGDLPDDYARGQRDEKLAIGFGVAGGVIAATGVLLFILDNRSGPEAPRASITPIIAPGTAGASAVWRF